LRSKRYVNPAEACIDSIAERTLLDRVGAAPISWGVCEVPGWGYQLPPEVVLAEMQALGIAETEAGPDGYLGGDVPRVHTLLERHGLELIGGFLPVVLHEPSQLETSLAKVRRTAAFYRKLGAHLLLTAVVVDEGWSPRVELSEAQWRHLFAALLLVDEAVAEHGVLQALHPHWGTLIESDADLRRVLADSSVRLCLDTGHLALAGTDPVRVVRAHPDRIAHVHLKDVDKSVAERLRSGELDLMTAVQAGLFQPLGCGDARINEVVGALEAAGYAGLYVLEQDTALTDAVRSSRHAPMEDVRRSVHFLHSLAAAHNGR
jgi:inosose dehydratase